MIALDDTKKQYETNALKLARWARANLFVRLDTYGTYYRTKDGVGQRRNKTPIQEGDLLNHFMGRLQVGTYTLNQDGESRFTCLDIDAHDEPIKANWAYARQIQRQCAKIGLTALIEDSNGQFGLKVWIIFNRPIPARHVRNLGLWLTQDKPEQVGPIEVFPKQDAIGQAGFGNFIRLPGKHHKREHWSTFFLNGEWHGPGVLLSLPLNDPDLIPHEAINFIRPLPECSWEEWDGEQGERNDWIRQYKGDLKTLRTIDLLEDNNLYIKQVAPGKFQIYCPWCADHTTGDRYAYLFHTPDSYPRFYCHHAHCQLQGRDLQGFFDRLGGPSVVDAYCDPFQTREDDWLNNPETQRRIDEATANADTYRVADVEIEEIGEDLEQPKERIDRNKIVLTWDELESMPDPEWQVTGLFQKESFAVLFGPYGSFKSFLALDWSYCVATGKPFLSRHEVAQGNVLYIAGEGLQGIKKRGRAWLKYHKEERKNFVVARGNNIVDPDYRKRLFGECPFKPDLVVVDTLNRLFGEGDENNPKDMGRFVKSCDWILEKIGATVLVVHHTGKDLTKGPRGHTTLAGAADTMIRAVSENKADVEIHCHKQKDEEPFSDFHLSKQEVAIGGDLRSLVLVSRESVAVVWQYLKGDLKNIILELYGKFAFGPWRFSDWQNAYNLHKGKLGEKSGKYWLEAQGKNEVIIRTEVGYQINANFSRIFDR